MERPDRAETLLPAPGRGQYDRALTRERRQAEQRERLMVATASAFARGQHSVSGVVTLAGVGRNTFYEYFDDFAHALEVVRARAQARAEEACEAQVKLTRTPVERLRAISRAWCGVLLEEPDEARVLLLAEPRTPEQPLTLAGRALARAYEHASQGGGWSAQHEPSRVLAVAAAAEVFVLEALGTQAELDATAALVSQVAIRLLH
jgi:AcrR family transcriptional regulator